MRIQPYLFFNGRCEEALEFYKGALGATVEMMVRFNESPEPRDAQMIPPESAHKIMHALFRIGDTAALASDGQCQGMPSFGGFSLTLEVATEAEAKQCVAALSEGGEILMPLARTFYSPAFAMLNDRFGLSWMVLVPQSA